MALCEGIHIGTTALPSACRRCSCGSIDPETRAQAMAAFAKRWQGEWKGKKAAAGAGVSKPTIGSLAEKK